MKGFVITSKGIEETACTEVKELINANCKAENSCVVFDFSKFEDLCLLCYRTQSADRVLYLIGSFEFRNFFDDFEKFIAEADFEDWVDMHNQFKVECIREGNHDFKSVDVEEKAREHIIKKSKGKKISKRDYEIVFLAYIIDNK